MKNFTNQEKEEDVIFGRNPILEAIRDGYEIEKIIIQDSLRGDFEKEIRQLCKTHNIPMSKSPEVRLNTLSGKGNHQGIVAYISPVRFVRLDDVLAHAFDQGKNPSVIVLENISDVRNLAAISRTALVMGFDAIVITAKNHARINADCVKVSAGAILKIPVCREKNMTSVFDILKGYGIQSFATDLHTKVRTQDADFTGPIAIILGSEDKGVTYESKQMADHQIKIPQLSEFDSLNVSVAAGIIMYEVVRQRVD